MKLLRLLPFAALLILAFSACKKDDEPMPESEPDFVQVDQYTKRYNNGVVEVSYLPVDETRSNSKKYDYYNFDKAAMVAHGGDELVGVDWHIAFYVSMAVKPNNLGDDYAWDMPWYEKTQSTIVVAGVADDFDNVKEVPNNVDYNQLPFYLVPALEGNKNELMVWATQVSNTETQESLYIKPIKRTYFFKLDAGRVVKFQFINCYQNKPEENNASSKIGYLSFRYFISKANSTDVKTK